MNHKRYGLCQKHATDVHMGKNCAKHSEAKGVKQKKKKNNIIEISAGKCLRLLQRDFLFASITSVGSIAFRSCFLYAKHICRSSFCVCDSTLSIYSSLKCDICVFYFAVVARRRRNLRAMKRVGGERDRTGDRVHFDKS